MSDIEIREGTTPSEKKVVGMQVTAEIYEQLKAIAERDFMSISDLLRKIVILYLRENK